MKSIFLVSGISVQGSPASALTSRTLKEREHGAWSWRCRVFHLLLCGALLPVALIQAQTTGLNLATQSKNADFSAFPFTRPVQVGGVLPATCKIGQLFFNTSVAAGTNLYGCTAPNIWTAMTSNTAVGGVSLSASTLDFGGQAPGTVVTKSVVLTNTGKAYLTLNGITVAGGTAADFLVASTCGKIVPSGLACNISVSFKPTQIGQENAVLVITSDAPGSPTSVTLSGSGVGTVSSGSLNIQPSATQTGEGDNLTLTSSSPVVWSLASGSLGKLTVINSTSAVFTAPSAIRAQNSFAGCPAAPNDSVFNTPINKLPVEASSATWAGSMGSIGLSFIPAWGLNIADGTTPVRSMSFFYTPSYNGPFVMPEWPNLKRQNGTFVSRANNTDHHIVTVRRDNCQFYETYNDWFVPGTCRDKVTPGCNATSGLTYSWNNYNVPPAGSTDAANLPLAPVTLHLDDIRSGRIKHAMRFTMAAMYVQPKVYWPANSSNGGCAGCTNVPPYGARFRLKASYVLTSFSPIAQIILAGLKEYGMILADIGTGPTISTGTDLTEDPTVMAALKEITTAKITMSNFEAVDESSFIVSKTSYRVNPANGYQPIVSSAVITATDPSNPSAQVSFPVALRSVEVGMPTPTAYMVAGLSGYQFPSWVGGSSNQNVSWTVGSGSGSVTTGGVYTPPPSVSAPSTTTLIATSAADPAATATLTVTVLPAGTNPAGGIRIDAGNIKGATDTGGNVWLPDQGFETGIYIQQPSDYPNWPSLASSNERNIYQSFGYTYGDDLVYRFIVPNGNYKIRLMMAQPYNGCSASTCITFDPSWRRPLRVEANNQVALHALDVGASIRYAYATPVDIFVPAKVIDNNLSVAVRPVVPEGTASSPSPVLTGLQIIPDSSAPRLAIDAQGQTSVQAGNTLQLYAVGWYVGNAVTWSLSGPGTIDANGLYTAPTTASGSAQSVTITATSTVTPTLQTTVTLTVPAGS